MPTPKFFTLLQVAQSVKKTLSDRYSSAFWVQAEMNKLNHYQYSGHCYPELVEKRDGKVIAQMNGILWKTDFLRSNQKFLDILKEPLRDGIKIMFQARIVFDAAHGLALQMLDIDPAYTLGDLERERLETIARLESEGVFDANKKLVLPILPQRIALISVETSKGYADFLSVLDGNPFGYKFFHFLFPSLLQGEKAVDGILQQLEKIRKVAAHFDVVAIVRGGGGDVGLSCYNNYRLVRAIATYPIPVLSGIGHATNETVSELVSHINAITPTKLADFLLQKFHNAAVPVLRAEEVVTAISGRILADKGVQLETEMRRFTMATGKRLLHDDHLLKHAAESLRSRSAFRLQASRMRVSDYATGLDRAFRSLVASEKTDLARVSDGFGKDLNQFLKSQELALISAERQVENMDPRNVLRRGFSITLRDGKAVRDSAALSVGEHLTTVLYDGSITSTITQINIEDE